MSDWISTLGFAMGSAWLSGINLYATVATLGLLQRFHFAHLPGHLSFLANWWVIGVAAGLYCIEFVADKVPAVDTAWDMIHTFIRVPAGAAMAAAAFADTDTSMRVIAFLLGGGVALSSHGAKTGVRVAANMSPEPVSNVALSLLEDTFTIGSSAFLVWFSVVILMVVICFVTVAILMSPKIVRAVRRLFRKTPAEIIRSPLHGSP